MVYQLLRRSICSYSAPNLAAIVYRIWTVRRGLVRPGATILTLTSGSPLTSIAIVLIESGLLYTMSIVILFGLYLASNNAQYGVSNAVRLHLRRQRATCS